MNWKKHTPNALTLARVIMSAVFFGFLGTYKYSEGTNRWALLAAIGIFIFAAVTDFFDGALARRWKVESQFGRIMDPFADKILIVGAFVVLGGPRFLDAKAVAAGATSTTWMASGVRPWMILSILARELLVTGIRDELESHGVKFGAMIWGKLKMFSQTIAIPVLLFILWLDPATFPFLRIVRDIVAHATVILTIVSGVPYIVSAIRSVDVSKSK